MSYWAGLILYKWYREDQKSSGEAISEERFNLQNLLISSAKYDPKSVLSKLLETKLILETATVYGS